MTKTKLKTTNELWIEANEEVNRVVYPIIIHGLVFIFGLAFGAFLL